MSSINDTPLPLIVGAGPVGMILSLWLLKYQIPHRIVDASPRSATTSRAVVIHARTLEIYRQLGLADAIVAQGRPFEHLAIHYDCTLQSRLPVCNDGRGVSRYPFVLSITQDVHEAIQEEAIIKGGGRVERNVRVVGIEDRNEDDYVDVTICTDGQNERFRASYVIGCDGARSTIRHSMHFDMEGGTYPNIYFVADIMASGYVESAKGQANLLLSRKDFCFLVPLPYHENRFRIIGCVPSKTDGSPIEDTTFEDVRPSILRNVHRMTIDKVNWFSAYKAHHRLASHFQKGRVFLCGDAAHVHSPVGGQGMNAGLGDATNLAWKLAAVHNGASRSLLETYSLERRPFAKSLVQTTDDAFTLITSSSYLGHFMRMFFVPRVFPFIFWLFSLGPTMYRKLSQIELEYHNSPLSAMVLASRQAKTVSAGDRLPWIESVNDAGQDNHAFLDSPGWQAHIFGTPPSWIIRRCEDAGVPLHIFPWTNATHKAGFLQDALYLIRPDGYIGLIANVHGKGADGSDVKRALDDYLQKWSIGSSGSGSFVNLDS